MTHQKFKGYLPGYWERTRKSWLPLPKYVTWATTQPCTVNWQNGQWFHQRTLQTNLFPALVHPDLNVPTFKTHAKVHFLWSTFPGEEKQQGWKNFAIAFQLLFFVPQNEVDQKWTTGDIAWHKTQWVNKAGCTPVQWRLDRWGKLQETNNIIAHKIKSTFHWMSSKRAWKG